MKSNLTFQSHEYRFRYGFNLFHQRITFIVDGTEQPIKTPKHSILNTRFYSSKYKQHSMNIILMISPNGQILWLSPSYPGGTNDNTIMIETMGLWMSELKPDEFGIGDQGFNGLHWLQDSHGRNLPIYTAEKMGDFGSVFSQKRCLVENAIRKVKIWACCKDEMRISLIFKKHFIDENLLCYHQKIWTIASVFTNLFHE